jgi:5-methylcytosine-specific restriction endonuclease McrA
MPQRVPRFRSPRLRQASLPELRPNAYQRGYCDRKHYAWRHAVLTRDNWQCRSCGRVCSNKKEAHADHIIPIGAGGERYELSNGQCLCQGCHNRKTSREG